MNPLRDTGFRKTLCLNPLSRAALVRFPSNFLLSSEHETLEAAASSRQKIPREFSLQFLQNSTRGQQRRGQRHPASPAWLGGPARAEGEGFRFRGCSPLPLPATWRLGR